MELEQIHIVPYLPYKLNIEGQTHKEIRELSGIRRETVYVTQGNNEYGWASLFEIKLVLRPLSDLTKEIEHNGEKFVPAWVFDENNSTINASVYLNSDKSRMYFQEFINPKSREHHLDFMPYGMIQKLFEWHFDVFGLIDQGLAITKK